jgi:hypothetical protein
MNGLPIIGRRVDRIDAERLNGIDELQHTLDLRTTGQPDNRNRISPPETSTTWPDDLSIASDDVGLTSQDIQRIWTDAVAWR